MALSAQQLRTGGGARGATKKIIREQLHMVDAHLQQMERSWGRNIAAIELDQTFGIDGLSKQNQQRVVYSTIVKSLIERGFEARLHITREKTTLYVAWEYQISEAYRSQMDKLLASCTIGEDGVEDFCRGRRVVPK